MSAPLASLSAALSLSPEESRCPLRRANPQAEWECPLQAVLQPALARSPAQPGPFRNPVRRLSRPQVERLQLELAQGRRELTLREQLIPRMFPWVIRRQSWEATSSASAAKSIRNL